MRLTPKPIVSALLILVIVGAYLGLNGKAQRLSKVKSVEEYWAETGLGAPSLEELLQEGSCQSSERYFLACANAVLSVAQRYGLSISTDGHIVPENQILGQTLSEKEMLAPWRVLISRKKNLPAISFLQLWRKFQSEHVKIKELSFVVGLGINGFLSVFKDPHTYLMPADLYKEVIAKSNHRSLSIGIVLGRDDAHYFIKKVIEGSAAYQAGLRKGDAILSVNGKKADDMPMYKLSEQLKGEEGSKLSFTLLREKQIKFLTFLRSESMLPSVSHEMVNGIKPVGLLTINKFSSDSCSEAKAALQDMVIQGMQGLLLDLRDNPGGQMDEASCIVSLFVGPHKKVFQVKTLDPSESDGEEVSYGHENIVYKGPMAVLVNSGSASASEIVAGALQDYKRASLVGEKTFGKGSFQEGELWSENNRIAIFETKGFYYLPSGRTPQLVGLQPDIAVGFKDRFALREGDQFTFPLKPIEDTVDTGFSLASAFLSTTLETCTSYESDLLPESDPEMKEARRLLSCQAQAQAHAPAQTHGQARGFEGVR